VDVSRVLVVSPYPPLRDGIGAYAVQQVRKLRAEGHDVEACSPTPTAAHHHLALKGPAGAAALGRLMRGYDRTIIHFHPDVFYKAPSTPGSRTTEGFALGAALRAAPRTEVRIHELDERWGDPRDPSSYATRWMLRGATQVQVHTAEQRDQLLERFGLPAERVALVDHGADFVAHTTVDREAARAGFGLPPDEHTFLCIGFVQAHKGFDRAVRAFAGLAERGAALHVVGSARVDDQQTADHLDELRRLQREIPGVHLHLGYVSDEAFDRWIVAADTVVLPYRHIWSSSVAERAALLGRPVIATRVGGLADQVGAMPGAVLVDDNAGLAAAMAAAVGGDGAAATERPRPASWPVDGGVDRTVLQEAVEARAAVVRGGPSAARAGDPSARKRYAAPSAALRRLRPLTPPAPVSARPGVSLVKKLARRLMAWEVDPIHDQLNALQRATTEAIDAQTDLLADRDR
jgi:glycosyltransferase involved in cell wall biosynthesis